MWSILADCQRALHEEIEAVQNELARRGLDRPVVAASIRSRGEAGGGVRYVAQVAGGMYDIRADDRVGIRSGSRESLGIVLRFDRVLGFLELLSPEWLGDRIEGAELTFDPTWLLRELSDRLLDVADDVERFFPDTVLAALGRRPPSLGRRPATLPTSDDLNRPQREALERLLGSDVQLVWGPPGTGKSRLVARAALELAARGRVLVTATTNGAVDEIARRLARIAPEEAIAGNRIIRVGSELGTAAIPELTLEAALERRIASGVGGILRSLEELEARVGIRAAEGRERPPHPRARAGRLVGLARVRDDAETGRAAGRILAEIGRQAVGVLEDADIVLTTLARLTIREELRTLRYASVLLEEASTAPLPYVTYAASCAEERLVAVGDFQQLPAIVSSRGPAAERWLRRDLFHETGVVATGEDGGRSLPSPADGLCAMLDLQYRMDPAIRALVSEFFYDGRLLDADSILARDGFDTSLLFLDTSALRPSVERIDGSRRNKAHADVVAGLLSRLADRGEADIAVVTPYRAQTRYLRDLARRRLGRAAPASLQVSTVHRFQGREKRVVILDTVDAPPGRSWFLDERRNPEFPRLLNVALSRARDMLVVVASREGLEATLGPEALLPRLLRRMEEVGRRSDARRVVSSRPVPRTGPREETGDLFADSTRVSGDSQTKI